jgi:hypothetical protein
MEMGHPGSEMVLADLLQGAGTAEAVITILERMLDGAEGEEDWHQGGRSSSHTSQSLERTVLTPNPHPPPTHTH